MQSKEPKLIRIKNAARQLGVSDQTLRKWVDSGVMQCVKLPKGERRFEQEEIDRMREVMRLDDENLRLYRELKDAFWQKGISDMNIPKDEYALYKYELAMARINENVKKLDKLSWIDILSEINLGGFSDRGEKITVKWGDLDTFRGNIIKRSKGEIFYDYILDQVDTEIKNRDRWLVLLGLKEKVK